jgi:hypothetical protein
MANEPQRKALAEGDRPRLAHSLPTRVCDTEGENR